MTYPHCAIVYRNFARAERFYPNLNQGDSDD